MNKKINNILKLKCQINRIIKTQSNISELIINLELLISRIEKYQIAKRALKNALKIYFNFMSSKFWS